MSLPHVSMPTAADAGSVSRYQTLCPRPSPNGSGSPASSEASTFVPARLSGIPTARAAAKSSLAGAFGTDNVSAMSPLEPCQPLIAMWYVVPAAAVKYVRPPPSQP